MARKLSDIQLLRDNTNASKTGVNYGSKRPIQVSDLRTWFNNNFFRGDGKNDNTPSTGSGGVPSTSVSVNNSFSDRTWVSLFLTGTSEVDHNYYKGTSARLQVKCYANQSAAWKLVYGTKEWTAASNGTEIDTGNFFDVIAGVSTYSPGTTTGSKAYPMQIHFKTSGSAYSTITGFTATMGFGTTNCSWSNGSDTLSNINGGAWDHLTYN
jgi:hypothetical protein